MSIKQLLKAPFKPFRRYRLLREAVQPLHPRSCPLCGYHGTFDVYGRPPRLDARCLKCNSLERHRLFWLWYDKNKERLTEPFLYFAPEKIFSERFRKTFSDYRTADFFNPADLKLNIEAIDLPDNTFGTVICNHVLEHVDDAKALLEMKRVLKPGGIALLSVPIIEGWDTTYEIKGVDTDLDREIHYGQWDHIRWYGRDFRDRLQAANFSKIEEITAEGPDVITYGLLRGEKFFVCTK